MQGHGAVFLAYLMSGGCCWLLITGHQGPPTNVKPSGPVAARFAGAAPNRTVISVRKVVYPRSGTWHQWRSFHGSPGSPGSGRTGGAREVRFCNFTASLVEHHLGDLLHSYAYTSNFESFDHCYTPSTTATRVHFTVRPIRAVSVHWQLCLSKWERDYLTIKGPSPDAAQHRRRCNSRFRTPESKPGNQHRCRQVLRPKASIHRTASNCRRNGKIQCHRWPRSD